MAVDLSRFIGDGVGKRNNHIKSVQVVHGNFFQTIDLDIEIDPLYSMAFPIMGHPSRFDLTETQAYIANNLVGYNTGTSRVSAVIIEFEPSAVKQVITGSISAYGRGFQREYDTDYFETQVDINKCVLWTNCPLDTSSIKLIYVLEEFTSEYIKGYWEMIGGSYTNNTTRSFPYKIIEFL